MKIFLLNKLNKNRLISFNKKKISNNINFTTKNQIIIGIVFIMIMQQKYKKSGKDIQLENNYFT